jgi:hypothetical protein
MYRSNPELKPVQFYLKEEYHFIKKRPINRGVFYKYFERNYFTNFTSVLLFNALPAAVLLVEIE